jgi:hydrogenase nickel incorporation protein HypA/HybF
MPGVPLHELSIAQSICEIVEQYVPAASRQHVRSVRVLVGELSGVVPDSLAFCFTAITAGTPLGGASLEITHVPLRAECRSCHETFHVEQPVFLCPSCGGSDLLTLSGRELQVSQIELNDEPSGTV